MVLGWQMAIPAVREVESITQSGRRAWLKITNRQCLQDIRSILVISDPFVCWFPLTWCEAISFVKGEYLEPLDWNVYSVCRMWAILLGCILREPRRNNRKGRKEQEKEGGASRWGLEGGGGQRITLSQEALRAIMQHGSNVYWMCLTINNQFIRTWWGG